MVSTRTARDSRATARAWVQVLALLSVLAVHHLLASGVDDPMSMSEMNSSSHAIAAEQAPQQAMGVAILQEPGATSSGASGCESAMLLCCALLTVAIAVAAATHLRRRHRLVSMAPRRAFGLPHRWLMYLRTPVPVPPRLSVVCRC